MWQDIINFDKMITPTIIKIIFWFGVAMSILTGFAMMFSGGFRVFLGLMTLVIGPLSIRVYCELLIVFFKMNESLVEIKNKTL